ncbi:MAG: DUF222 domain-containing protein [Actinobacteria bacterium]|nr:DUF222 domain-containing protein [Actinomycetota bacterium]
MDATGVPTTDEMVSMSPAALMHVAHLLDVDRRVGEARQALLLQRVDAVGAQVEDGFRQVAGWGRAACNWSGAEASRLAKLGRAMQAMPTFAAACLAGHVGVAQMHAVAAVAGNPRVRDHLAAADALFTRQATSLPFDDLVTFLQHWVELADADGARSRHDRAAQQRRASVQVIGERSFVDAAGPAMDGVFMREVFDRYCEIEWRNEWDEGVRRYGDIMHPGLMERTPAQRRFDALRRLFDDAAGSQHAGGEVTVNIVVDQATFEHHLEAALGGTPTPADPSTAVTRRCEDHTGAVIDPRAMIAAALVGRVRRMVLSTDGVVLDFGRRKRLFTGALREAVLLAAHHCGWVGCHLHAADCQADHVLPFSHAGPTSASNGAPLCDHHNPLKNKGYRTWRDPDGLWHTYRPDGTELGWPIHRIHYPNAA